MKNKQFKIDVNHYLHRIINEISALPESRNTDLQKHNVLQLAASAGSIFELNTGSNTTSSYAFKLNELSRLLGQLNFWINYFFENGNFSESQKISLLEESEILANTIKYIYNTEIIEMAETYRGEWFLED
jgi:hypothetical protein